MDIEKIKKIFDDIASKPLNSKIIETIDKVSNQLENMLSLLDPLEMGTKYDHLLVEKNKAFKWKVNSFLEVKNKSKKPFSIILPPPNVTGKLHLGHAWNGSIQDAIIRYKKAKGFDTLFIPAMDHAGIATQAKVEAELAKQNIYKNDLGKEKFIEEVWDWKIKYAKNIRKQWDSLGLTFDFLKEKFTLDDSISEAVNKAFIDMYNDGLIYQSNRAINWDCKLKTSLSNIEVIPKEETSKMYYLKYNVVNSKETLIVATTRVETLFSDVAVAINPKDKRFKHLLGKYVINPLTKKKLIVINDEYVQLTKGTGAMKVSAHATADIDIIKNNNLKVIECIDENGLMNSIAKEYEGLDRFVAREKIAKLLQKNKMIDKIEEITSNVGYSQRSNTVVEILVSKQWFIKMKPLAKLVLNNLKNKNKSVRFFPIRFCSTLKTWMENVEDWNISRQLWWGHQIPVWYKGKQMKVQVESPGKEWIQDEDVLDTWFSSSLAPFAFLDWPNKSKDLKRYYPTSVIVSAYDIIFFWIARMYFNGLYFQKKIPFHQALIHGLIRDEQGRKMSKSLGNGIDPFKMVEKYGADALRWFLLTNSTPGQDLRFSETKVKAAWNFNNKLWNISRFIISKEHQHMTKRQNDHDKWILVKLTQLNTKVSHAYNKYEFTIVKKLIESFVYNEFSKWYIEMSKSQFNKEVAIKVLSDVLIMIHPIMPFITEDIYMRIHNKTITKASWPIATRYKQTTKYIDDVIEIIKSIRVFRVTHNLSNKDIVYYWLDRSLTMKIETLIYKLSNAKAKKNDDALFVLSNYRMHLKMTNKMKDAENKRIEKEIIRLENEIKRSKKILNNKKFIENASEQKITKEEEKYENYKKAYELLKKEK